MAVMAIGQFGLDEGERESLAGLTLEGKVHAYDGEHTARDGPYDQSWVISICVYASVRRLFHDSIAVNDLPRDIKASFNNAPRPFPKSSQHQRVLLPVLHPFQTVSQSNGHE